MKKMVFLVFLLLLSFFITGCSFDSYAETVKESTKPKVSCSIEKQYSDEYGYSYYVEGKCTNNDNKDYDYLQVEFVCYDKDGTNLGTAMDNTNNLLKGQTWKFKAMSLYSDTKNTDHCDYHEASGW